MNDKKPVAPIFNAQPMAFKPEPLPGVMSTPNRSAGECEQSFLGERVSEYLAGLEMINSLPGTIEDEMPPVSQAFADKVKAMGGIMTPYGLVCDPAAPVEGKRYMRLARAVFRVVYNPTERHVEDTEFRIRNYARRNKNATDWEGMTAHLTKCLKLAIAHRHNPALREPIYANKE